jgi:hypothetical protein
MSDPDEAMVEAVRRAIHTADNEWASAPRTEPHEPWDLYVTKAVLSVPVVRDALARDAQVREIAKTWTDRLNGNDPWPTTVTIEAMASIAALCPSPGDRDDSEEQR